MSSTEEGSQAVGQTAGLLGVPPLLATAAVIMLCQHFGVSDKAVTPLATATGLLVGWMMLSMSRRREARRARAVVGHNRGITQTEMAELAKSTLPRGLLIALAGLTFSLVDFVSGLVGYGTILWTDDGQLAIYDLVGGADSEGHAAYAMTVPVSLTWSLLIGIPVTIWFAHRLRSNTVKPLAAAVAIFTIISLTIQAYFSTVDESWLLWQALFVVLWLVNVAIGASLASRTQAKFDLARAAWLKASATRE